MNLSWKEAVPIGRSPMYRDYSRCLLCLSAVAELSRHPEQREGPLHVNGAPRSELPCHLDFAPVRC